MSLRSGPVYGSQPLYIHTYIQELLETDVTLTDDDAISILADDAKRVIWGC